MVYNYVDVSVYKDIDITVNCFIFFYYIGYSWRSAPGSFIFSLRNNDNIGPFQSPLKDDSTYRAIFNSPIYGPLFVYGAWSYWTKTACVLQILVIVIMLQMVTTRVKNVLNLCLLEVIFSLHPRLKFCIYMSETQHFLHLKLRRFFYK